ncbi:TKL protein kinase [Phytophthora palmivora]|uniref:TKL protein kinase n=1 Tax=Phytophthora palmivora TaxID=4796 RepID=A0A2P4XS68_9STRA|nr:TKL protein kinase [Phytophthora palmivora]
MVFLLITAQLIFNIIGAQECFIPANTLTTSCNESCGMYEPCLVYNSTECSDSSSNTENCTSSFDMCSYACFQAFGAYNSDPTQFIFLVSSGTEDVNNNGIYATANITAIDQLVLSPQTTDVWIQGGDYQQINKGKIVELELAPDLLTSQSQVRSVSLMSMNLSAKSYDIPYMIPNSTTTLSLSNTLLTEFPSHLSSLSNIMILWLCCTYNILCSTTFTCLLTLTCRDLHQNSVSTFEGNFPGLTELYLNINNLTEIPAVVFTFKHLTKLAIQNNPFTSRSFTESQITFLQGLTSLDLVDSDFQVAVNCSLAEQRVAGNNNVVVCVSDFASTGSVSGEFSDSSSSSSNYPISRISYSSGSTSVDKDHSNDADRSSLPLIVAMAIIIVLIVLIVTAIFYWQQHINGSTRGVHNSMNDDSSKRRATELWDDDDMLQLQVNCDDIQDIRVIGGGASTIVWLIRYRNSVLLASKRLREVISTEQAQTFVDEIKLASKLDHPNIVTFIGAAWSTRFDMQALFEYVENGDLHSYLAPSRPRYWTRIKLQLAVDVIEALVYVHTLTPPLVHQELSSRNVLISTDMQAKLSGFTGSRLQSVNRGIGSSRWLAPEIISGTRDYDQAADIFTFGVLLSEFDTHEFPYSNIAYDNAAGESGNTLGELAILQKVANGTLRPAFSDTCPPIILELAKQCMSQEPRDRPLALKIAYTLRMLQREAFNM